MDMSVLIISCTNRVIREVHKQGFWKLFFSRDTTNVWPHMSPRLSDPRI